MLLRWLSSRCNGAAYISALSEFPNLNSNGYFLSVGNECDHIGDLRYTLSKYRVSLWFLIQICLGWSSSSFAVIINKVLVISNKWISVWNLKISSLDH